MNIRNTLLLFLSAMSFTSLFAQEKLSLSDAIQRGLENNYQIKVADLDIEIAQNK